MRQGQLSYECPTHSGPWETAIRKDATAAKAVHHSSLGPMHDCGAPGCGRRTPAHYFCCAQHRSLLGFELSLRMQTDWRERRWDRQRFERTRAEAYRQWGWTPEAAACPSH